MKFLQTGNKMKITSTILLMILVYGLTMKDLG
jgi:hypothetical protein